MLQDAMKQEQLRLLNEVGLKIEIIEETKMRVLQEHEIMSITTRGKTGNLSSFVLLVYNLRLIWFSVLFLCRFVKIRSVLEIAVQ